MYGKPLAERAGPSHVGAWKQQRYRREQALKGGAGVEGGRKKGRTSV